jgi:hypothetical protein
MVIKTTYVFEAIDNISDSAKQMTDSLQKIGDKAKTVSGPLKEEGQAISSIRDKFNDLFKSLDVEPPRSFEQQANDLKDLLNSSNQLPKTVSEIEKLQESLRELSSGSPVDLEEKLQMSKQEVQDIVKKLDDAKKKARESELGGTRFGGFKQKVGEIKDIGKSAGSSMMAGDLGGTVTQLAKLGVIAALLAGTFGAIIATVKLFQGAIDDARKRTYDYVMNKQTLREGLRINEYSHREMSRYDRDLPMIKELMTIGNILDEWFSVVNDVMVEMFGGVEGMANLLDTIKGFVIQVLATVGAGIILVRSILENASFFFAHVDELLPQLPEVIVGLLKVVIYTAASWIITGLQTIAESLSFLGGGGIADSLKELQTSLSAEISSTMDGMSDFFSGFTNPLEDASTAYDKIIGYLGQIQYDDHKIMIQGEKTLHSLEGFVDIARSTMFRGGMETGQQTADVRQYRHLAGIWDPNEASVDQGGTPSRGVGVSDSYKVPKPKGDSSGNTTIQNNGDKTQNNNVTVNLKLDALSDNQLSRLGTIILGAITTEMGRNSGNARDPGL